MEKEKKNNKILTIILDFILTIVITFYCAVSSYIKGYNDSLVNNSNNQDLGYIEPLVGIPGFGEGGEFEGQILLLYYDGANIFSQELINSVMGSSYSIEYDGIFEDGICFYAFDDDLQDKGILGIYFADSVNIFYPVGSTLPFNNGENHCYIITTYDLLHSSSGASPEELQSKYNEGYNKGYSFGYLDGVNSVDLQNYYNNGYDSGYSDGLSKGANYTFLSLVGAVIDAPVQAFTNLFNFEIFDMNITRFLLSIFTIAIIFFILKKVVGNK